MYNLTLKGQGQNLTLTKVKSGQGHSVTQVGQIIHHSMRLAETIAMTEIPTSLSHLVFKLLTKNGW